VSATRSVLLDTAREFNSRRFFEAHEALEERLDDVDESDWELGIGLIQIAVGYHKASQGLWSGALLMLEKGLEKVTRFPPEVATLQLEELRARVRQDAERIRCGDFTSVDLERDPPRFRFRA